MLIEASPEGVLRKPASRPGEASVPSCIRNSADFFSHNRRLESTAMAGLRGAGSVSRFQGGAGKMWRMISGGLNRRPKMAIRYHSMEYWGRAVTVQGNGDVSPREATSFRYFLQLEKITGEAALKRINSMETSAASGLPLFRRSQLGLLDPLFETLLPPLPPPSQLLLFDSTFAGRHCLLLKIAAI